MRNDRGRYIRGILFYLKTLTATMFSFQLLTLVPTPWELARAAIKSRVLHLKQNKKSCQVRQNEKLLVCFVKCIVNSKLNFDADCLIWSERGTCRVENDYY